MGLPLAQLRLPRGGWITGTFEGHFAGQGRSVSASPTTRALPLQILDGVVKATKVVGPPRVDASVPVLRQPRLRAWVELDDDGTGRPRVVELSLVDVHLVDWTTEVLVDDITVTRGVLRGKVVARLDAPSRIGAVAAVVLPLLLLALFAALWFSRCDALEPIARRTGAPRARAFVEDVRGVFFGGYAPASDGPAAGDGSSGVVVTPGGGVGTDGSSGARAAPGNPRQNQATDKDATGVEPIGKEPTGDDATDQGPRGEPSIRISVDETFTLDEVLKKPGAFLSSCDKPLVLPTTPLFDPSSDTIRAGGEPTVKALSKLLRAARKGSSWRVVGHTDEGPPARTSDALSLARAQRVAQRLVRDGAVAKKRVRVEGQGDDVPLLAAANVEEARARNRRIEISRVCPGAP